MAVDRLLACIDKQGPEDGLPVDIAQCFGAGAFGVGHHPDDIPGLITYSCYVPEGAVGEIGRAHV